MERNELTPPMGNHNSEESYLTFDMLSDEEKKDAIEHMRNLIAIERGIPVEDVVFDETLL